MPETTANNHKDNKGKDNEQRVDQLTGPRKMDPFDVAESDTGKVEFRYRHMRRLDVDASGIALELQEKSAQQVK